MIHVKGSGGGGVNIKEATATPADVMNGVTFFAGESKEMQTGTLTKSTVFQMASGSTGATHISTVTGLAFTPLIVIVTYGGSGASVTMTCAYHFGNHASSSHIVAASGTRSISMSITVSGNTFSMGVSELYYTNAAFTWVAYG